MEFGRQRDFSEFYDQLNELRSKFRNWDSCEKTVALYYLMVGLPFANARFLQNALDQLVAAIHTSEAKMKEQNANNPEVIQSFLSENPQSALCLLLNHLPMLRPGNKEAARCYLNTIQRILTEFIAPPFKKIYNECVEIMSYVYIHPAFDKEDKTTFKHLLKQVLNRVTPENFVHSPVNESNPTTTNYCQSIKKRSNSLTPGTPYLTTDTDSWSSQENLIPSFQKPRSYSLSCDKHIVEVPNIQSSSSDSKLEEVIRNNFPLMKSIMSWLKSLRLHKYSWIFQDITASQMLNLTEEHLIEAGVTKGARQKLILSIEKLKNRKKSLSDLEIGLMNGSDVYEALKELKSIVQSPMQIDLLGEDLCSLFVKVMGKVCSQLLMLRQPNEEVLVLFSSLCEKADSLDCFTVEQKKKLNMWKGQLDARNMFVSYPQRLPGNGRSRNGSGRTSQQQQKAPLQQNLFEMAASTKSNAQKSSSYPNMQINSIVPLHRHSVDSVTLQNQLIQVKTNSDQVGKSSSNISHSNITSSSLKNSLESQSLKNNCDIENSLESLCIQMMEHALGP